MTECTTALTHGRLVRAAAFTATFGLLLLYALRGGSYDLVARQEVGLGIWWLLGLGFALGLLPRAPMSGFRLLPLLAVAMLAIWIAVGFAWSESAERTSGELARLIAYGGLALVPLALLTQGTWRAAAAGIAAAALGVAALAVVSRLFPGLFPADPVRAAFGGQRLNYPFHYWNAVGAWGAMAIAMGLAWSAHAYLLVSRIVALAAIPVAGLAVYLTYSRGGIAATVIGVVAVIALSRNRWMAAAHAVIAALATTVGILAARDAPQIARATGNRGAGQVLLALALCAALCAAGVAVTHRLKGERWRLAPRPARATLASALVALAILGAIVGPGLARRAWNQFSHTSLVTPSTATADPATRLTSLSGTRREVWASALDAFAAHPRGTGAGTFEFWWERDARNPEFVRNAHSIYLESLAEIGWPGLLFVLALLGSSLLLAIRAWSRLQLDTDRGAVTALIAAFVVFLFSAGVDWMWQSTGVTALALLAIATAAVPRRPSGEESGAVRPSGRMRGLARVVLSGTAILACLVELPALAATSQVRRSQEAVRAGALGTARRYAQEAVDAEPWAASPYVQRGLVEERVGNLQLARVDLQHAITREVTNWRHELLMARIEAELGRPAAALSAYARARRLHPLSPVFRRPPTAAVRRPGPRRPPQ